MPDTMIERIARVLLRERLSKDGHASSDAFEKTVNEEWPQFAHYVRLLLVEMREPTKAMILAAHETETIAPEHISYAELTKRRFAAMIDAALAEGA
ncbi:hypothetical protein [Sphingomonas oligoaromativorans]|uniref:hypothetical protein n=1 Tax=Sphingomonas oligoaromativorans TaxID=575322 RepID=UPI00141E025A|nr:hypothetical protein [Sphingomonas oligoaromativorans]NIJ35268.1 hypothetical protein [Sphingomonas oligoaromativorans]